MRRGGDKALEAETGRFPSFLRVGWVFLSGVSHVGRMEVKPASHPPLFPVSDPALIPSICRLILVVLLLTVSGCTGPAYFSPSGAELIPPPAPSEVETVLFLVGDPGDAMGHTSPVMERLRQDVEWWSGQLEADSSVAIVVLGDIVYPLGMNPPDSEEWPRDTSVVMTQLRLVSGPQARAKGTRIYFIAGNHDWGLREDFEGYVRLRRLEEFIEEFRTETDLPAFLEPPAGSGGPFVVDWGSHHRLILLDTAWWLLAADYAAQTEVLQGIQEAFASAGDRELLILAHHPFHSAGPHGGGFPFWEAAGLRYILHRSGAILQDVSSLPYRRLETGLRAIYAQYRLPQAFIGGHEHSLQILLGIDPLDPPYNLVSGSASKLSELTAVKNLVFGQAAPGYMRYVIERNGGVSIFVEAGDPEYLHCTEEEPERTRCMAEGLATFSTVFSRRIVDGVQNPRSR